MEHLFKLCYSSILKNVDSKNMYAIINTIKEFYNLYYKARCLIMKDYNDDGKIDIFDELLEYELTKKEKNVITMKMTII